MKNRYLDYSRFYLKAAVLLLIPFLLIILFNFIAGDILLEIDDAISVFAYSLRSDSLNKVMRSITFLADMWSQVIIVIAFMLITRIFLKLRVTPLWYGLTALLGSYFLNRALKDVFQRLRPDISYHLVVQDGFSFPSGHAMGSMIMFGGIAFILSFHVIKKQKTRNLMNIGFLILILLIGFSRIYLGVHYFSDVIGGFLAGASWLSLSISFYYRYYGRYQLRDKGEE